MRPRALALFALLSLGVLVAARPASSAPDTAQQLSLWFRRGVDRVAASVQTGAADLWVAGKAAVAAGERKLDQPVDAAEK